MAFLSSADRQAWLVSDGAGTLAVFRAGGKWFLFDAHSLNVFGVERGVAERARDAAFWSRLAAGGDDESGLGALYRQGQLFTADRHGDRNPLADVPLLHLCLLVSSACNLRCGYCFYAHGPYTPGPGAVMSPAVGRQAIDFFLANSEQPDLEVSFFGGEPLLAWDTVRSVVEYAAALGRERGRRFNYHITTNGTMLSEQVVDFLTEHGFSVILSIDGAPDIQDRQRPAAGGGPSSPAVERWARHLASGPLRAHTTARATYTAASVQRLSETVAYLAQLGFADISIEPAYGRPGTPDVLGVEHLGAIEQAYERLVTWFIGRIERREYVSLFHLRHFTSLISRQTPQESECGAGLGLLAVTPEGDLFPCDGLAMIDEHRLGTVAGGLDRGRQERWRKGVNQKGACQGCWAKYVCGGGCRAWAYAFGDGEIDTPLPFNCEMVKLLFRYSCLFKSELPRPGAEPPARMG